MIDAGDTPTAGYAAQSAMCCMIQHMATSGAPLGRPQRGHETKYDVASGRPYRPGLTLQAEEAAKIVTAANAMGWSVSGLFNELAKRMPVDADGIPTWYEPNAAQPSLDVRMTA